MDIAGAKALKETFRSDEEVYLGLHAWKSTPPQAPSPSSIGSRHPACAARPRDRTLNRDPRSPACTQTVDLSFRSLPCTGWMAAGTHPDV